MPSAPYLIAGIGELLWDLFPEGRQLGGAPANFAYIASLLGNHGLLASRMGQDELGANAIRQLEQRSLDCSYLQTDPARRTGTVQVTVDSTGQPSFQIAEGVAWDALAWTPEWQKLAQEVDAVCFGTLAQRSPASRETIRKFLQSTLPGALRVFDANLRQAYYSAEVLKASCELADVIKMNDQELPEVLELLDMPRLEAERAGRGLMEAYRLQLVCLTRGNKGSLLIARDASHSHPGMRVKVADTVGAGDAFTAGLVHEYLRQKGQPVVHLLDNKSLATMNLTANRMGAWVAGRTGGMPPKNSQEDFFFD